MRMLVLGPALVALLAPPSMTQQSTEASSPKEPPAPTTTVAVATDTLKVLNLAADAAVQRITVTPIPSASPPKQEELDLKSIRDSASKIQMALGPAVAKRELPAEYRRLLDEYAAFLQSLQKASADEPTVAAARVKRISIMAQDLLIKSGGAQHYPTAAPFITEIKVEVQTLDSEGKKVDGLRVRANPAWSPDKTNPRHIFDTVSSPTAKQMPPGRYVIWAMDSRETIVGESTFDIGDGENPDDRETIQLVVGTQLAVPAKAAGG